LRAPLLEGAGVDDDRAMVTLFGVCLLWGDALQPRAGIL
jgi:hypothetical protein